MTDDDKYSQVADMVSMGSSFENAMSMHGIPAERHEEFRKAVELKLTGRKFHHRTVNKDKPQ